MKNLKVHKNAHDLNRKNFFSNFTRISLLKNV